MRREEDREARRFKDHLPAEKKAVCAAEWRKQ